MTITQEIVAGSIVAVLGFVTIATGYAKSFIAWLKSFGIVSVWVDDPTLSNLVSYLNEKGRRVGGPKVYTANTLYIPKKGFSEVVLAETLNQSSSTFLFKKCPIWVSKSASPLVEQYITFRVSVVRGSINIESLIADACAWVSEGIKYAETRFRVVHHHGHLSPVIINGVGHLQSSTPPSDAKTVNTYIGARNNARRLLRHQVCDIIIPPNGEPLDSMVMSHEARILTQDIRQWFADRAWCHEHKVPWRMGYLYEGPPGSGKTTHARGIAVELDLPVHVFDLATMNNEDLRLAWKEMTDNAPCMALLEDIDRVFDGDRNVTPQGSLTFNALLNEIDGIERHDGVLLIITTNHMDKVDPALKDRRGRVDQIVHFGPLGLQERMELAHRIVEDPALATRLAVEHEGAQVSTLVSACCAAARRNRYKIDMGPMRTSWTP